MREEAPPPADDSCSLYPWHRYVAPLEDLSQRFPEAVRHLAMRAQFVQCMLEDPKIEQAVCGVRRRALDVAMSALLEHLANGEGLSGVERESFSREYDGWARRVIRAIRRVLEAFDTPKLDGGLRWPWLLQDISTWYWQAYLDEMLMGNTETELQYVLEPPRRRVAAAQQRPGESDREFFARLKTEALPGRVRGRAPRKKLERQRQYAVWFYRHHVLGETIGQLARDYHDTEHAGTGRRQGRTISPRGMVRKDRCDDRPEVEYGIRQGERYLRAFPSLVPRHGGK